MSATEQADAWAFLDEQHESLPWDGVCRLADTVAADVQACYALHEYMEEMTDIDPPPGFAPWLLAGAALLLAVPRLTEQDRRAFAAYLLDKASRTDDLPDFDFEWVQVCVGRMGATVLPSVIDSYDRWADDEQNVSHGIVLWSLLALAVESDDAAERERVIQRCVAALQRVRDEQELVSDEGYYCEAAWLLACLEYEPLRPLLTALATRRYDGIAGRSTREGYKHALQALDDPEERQRHAPTWHEPVETFIGQWWDHAMKPRRQPPAREALRPLDAPEALQPYRREAPKVGRNEPCPCGSKRKYKKCCGARA